MRIFKHIDLPLTLASAGGALALAWLVKDRLTPYLLGTAFAERSLAVKAALILAFTAAFFIYISFLRWLNTRVTETTKISPRTYLAITGGLTGALVFLFIFGPGTLDGTRVDWLMGIGDNAMHYLGWVFYRHDAWTFPLTQSISLAYPYGISVSLTDPVTLFILPFKLLSPLLPEPYQYFGLWTVLCFILQGAFAALIVYEVSRSRLAALLAPLFFCSAVILIYRVYTYIPHVGQWTVLAALYLFLLNRRAKRLSWAWPAVLVAGMLVQPYLVGIIFVVFLAAVLERLIYRKDWRAAIGLAGSLAAVALAMWITGMAGGDYDMAGAGVDYFKTNLNSLVNPIYPTWSAFLPPLPLATNTYPNLHYLGFGMILLFVFTLGAYLSVHRGSLGKILKANAVLLGMVLVLTVLSLGNVVTLNEKILFTYYLPAPLMRVWAIFKATERFLWPVTYLIFIFAVAQTALLFKRRWLTAAVLLAALAVQYADLAPILREKFETYADPQGYSSPLKSAFWKDAGAQYRHLVMLPLNLRDWAWLTDFAAQHRMTTNYFYFGRDTAEISAGAEQKIRDLQAGRPSPGELYVLTDSSTVKAACGLIRAGAPFIYVNGQFVLAPDFKGDLGAYPDVAVTGENFACERVSLAQYLEKYRDNLIVLSIKEDGAEAIDRESVAALRSLGLTADLRGQVGMSYIGVVRGGKVLFEQLSDGRLDFEGAKGEDLPTDLRVSSAGRISGEEISEIVVDGKDYSFGRRGLNIAVLDPATRRVLSAALFEMLDGVTNY
jgi:hypothetical protein